MKPGNEPIANIVTEKDGSIWYEITEYCEPNSKYYHLGIALAPNNKFRWIIWHICMGMISQYPLWDIFKFVIKDVFNLFPDYSKLPNAEYDVIDIVEME